MTFVADLVDLRSAVAVERVLDAGQAPFEDHPLAPTALHAMERALTVLDALDRQVDELSFRELPRAKALTAGSVLGTLRGTLRDGYDGDALVASPSGIERAARTLWSPFNSFLVQQVTRAHGEIDDAIGLAGGALTASSPRAQRLFALHDALERMLGTRRATLFDVPTRALSAAFAEALTIAVEALPHPCTESDVAPWLVLDGLVPRHLDLAEALLRALVRHRTEPARALLLACNPPVIHNSSTS